MFWPRPCFATLSKSRTPRNPDSRASSGVMSGNPIVSMESISMAPSSMRYLLPTETCGRVQKRTLHVISPRRTPARSRLVNIMSFKLPAQKCSERNGAFATITSQSALPRDTLWFLRDQSDYIRFTAIIEVRLRPNNLIMEDLKRIKLMKHLIPGIDKIGSAFHYHDSTRF